MLAMMPGSAAEPTSGDGTQPSPGMTMTPVETPIDEHPVQAPKARLSWLWPLLAVGAIGFVIYRYRAHSGGSLSGKRSKSKSRSSDSSVRSPTRTRTEVRSPTSTSTDVRSPTSTSTETDAYTAGNVTVTGGAGEGATTTVTIRGSKPQKGDPRHARGRDGVRKARIHATDVQDRSQTTRQHATDTRRKKR